MLNSCIEPYELKIKGTRKALVIDALVTNIEGEQFVRLQYSYPINGSTPELVSDATVMVVDNFGNQEPFNEVSPGFYQPSASFAGVVGRKYRLIIGTPDGNQYESEEEELLAPGEVSSVYGEYLTLRSETDDGFDKRVQFFVNVDGVSDQNHNYRFEFEENYEIRVPVISFYEFDPTIPSIDLRSTSIRDCYVNEQSTDLLIATTSGQISSNLRDYPVVFIKEEEPDLLGKYSLTVKAYRISSNSYQFYKDLKENNESAGSFFDRQKGILLGNVSNVSDRSEPVLGYFEVSGVSQRHQIFERNTWSDEGFSPDPLLLYCYDLLETVRTADLLSGQIKLEHRLIHTFADGSGSLPGTPYLSFIVLAPAFCCDCQNYGTLNRPEFWD